MRSGRWRHAAPGIQSTRVDWPRERKHHVRADRGRPARGAAGRRPGRGNWTARRAAGGRGGRTAHPGVAALVAIALVAQSDSVTDLLHSTGWSGPVRARREFAINPDSPVT